MRVVPVYAYGLAGTLRPREVVSCLGDASNVRVTKTLAIAAHGGDRFVVVHDFGAVVFFGMEADARDACVQKILEKAPPEPHAPLVDDFLVEVEEGAAPSSSFDRARVPELDLAIVEIISLALAQSVAMDYYDQDVEEMFARVNALSMRIAEQGRVSGSTRELTRFIGSTLVARNQIEMTLSLLDAPSVTWEREVYDRLHRAMRGSFEIEDRHRTLQHKLGVVQDDLSIIVDLVQSRRSWVLEIVVVVLIAFELIMGFVRR